ncbi:MAG TPA: hypothetical protein VEJ84_04390, partial [Acidimicrobiales bacterium]|nr:hypothetical protein [Acidimicrobiales bacterium]
VFNPVSGNELDEPLVGAIRFNQVQVDAKALPSSSSATLARGVTSSFVINIENSGVAPEAYFVDARADRTTTMVLKNLSPGTSATRLVLPEPAKLNFPVGVPLYLVPPGTTQLNARLTVVSGRGTVTFDMSPVSGDPDIGPGQDVAGATGSVPGRSGSVTLNEPEVAPGFWDISPAEVGPFSGRERHEVVSARVSVVTQAFDPTVTSDTDDLWQVGLRFNRFHYLEPDQSAAIHIDITPTAPVGTQVSGTLYIDDVLLLSFVAFPDILPFADVVAAIPYSYTVGIP